MRVALPGSVPESSILVRLSPRFDNDQSPAMAEKMSVYDLVEGWEFKQTDLEEWMPVKTVPTNVHLDLMANER